MVGETTPASGTQREARYVGVVWSAMWVGFILALVGLADGFKIALERRVVTCPNETQFPPGTTNFTCYVHPNAGTGTAIAVISVLLGILVALSAVAAATGLRNGSTALGVPAADHQASS
jgi:hypothetical protein